jgi:DNA-binding Lrp family transcriptional regulator
MIGDKEKQLLIKLRKNSRANVNDIAKELKYATSTMYDMLHRLEAKNIITHTSKVAFEKIGYPIKVFIIIKTSLIHKDKLKEYLQNKPNINSLHIINHRSNFHIECIFRNQIEVEEFLEELEDRHALSEINVYTVLETIHTERFLTEKEHFTN